MPSLEPGYIYARIKPYNPKFGHVKMRFAHSPSGLRFLSAGDWYVIPEEYENLLSKVLMDDGSPTGPKAFDFAHTELEMKGVEADYRQMIIEAQKRAGRPTHEYVRQFKREDLRAPPSDADSVLTTASLPGGDEDEGDIVSIPEPTEDNRDEAVPVSAPTTTKKATKKRSSRRSSRSSS
jgi:hypothetical protein